jgi:hypothetical protein
MLRERRAREVVRSMTQLGPHLIEQLIGALAEELAPRIAAEVAAQLPPPPAAEPWHLLDLEEAADRIGRSTRWVRERAKRGDLPFVRLDGGRLAFELDDLRVFARDRRIPLAARLQANGNSASDAASALPHLPGNQKVRGVGDPPPAKGSSRSPRAPGGGVQP